MEIGQKIILEKRHSQNEEIIEAIITKIGHKYFYVNTFFYSYKFPINRDEDGTENSYYYNIHFSLEDYNNEVEKRKIFKILSRHFSYGNYSCFYEDTTLKQLKEIAKILKYEIE